MASTYRAIQFFAEEMDRQYKSCGTARQQAAAEAFLSWCDAYLDEPTTAIADMREFVRSHEDKAWWDYNMMTSKLLQLKRSYQYAVVFHHYVEGKHILAAQLFNKEFKESLKPGMKGRELRLDVLGAIEEEPDNEEVLEYLAINGANYWAKLTVDMSWCAQDALDDFWGEWT